MAGEVARSLWPELCAGLRGTRHELGQLLRTARERPRAGLELEGAALCLEQARLAVRRVGWCLALLSSSLGHDLLRGRSEREGLRWLAAALAEARGAVLVPGALSLPRLDGGAGVAGQELCVLAAWAFLESLRGGSCSVAWSVQRRGRRRVLVVELAHAATPGLAARCARLRTDDPRAPSLVLGVRPEGVRPEATGPEGARLELGWSEQGDG